MEICGILDGQLTCHGSSKARVARYIVLLLASPQFLVRAEKEPASVATGRTHRITDLELASRLSFFLWSSIPDDQLISLASQGKLSNPTVLEQQVKRMLADPRSDALIENFAAQLLYLRNLPATSPDGVHYPDWDDELRKGFRRETELLFESIMHEDRNVVDLLTADYTFLNERLARHYGIPNIRGSQFRRVELAESTHRGGLLGQGGILTLTSYSTRTSPVLRGKYVLENLLASPPPPPTPALPRAAAPVAPRRRLPDRRPPPLRPPAGPGGSCPSRLAL